LNVIKGTYHLQSEKPAERLQRLRHIKATLLPADVLRMALELQFNVAIEEFFKDFSQSAALYEKGLFNEFLKYLKSILTPESIKSFEIK
jgi:hypothetical protein